tara:strand:- start:1673 stop:1918 length:246 start_codon:yes stop_codon:yes gene_type:complete
MIKKMSVIKLFFINLVFVVILTGPATAYIGPGLGLGAIAVMFGVIGSIIFAIFAIFYYPIKRIILKFKKNKNLDQNKDNKN